MKLLVHISHLNIKIFKNRVRVFNRLHGKITNRFTDKRTQNENVLYNSENIFRQTKVSLDERWVSHAVLLEENVCYLIPFVETS